MERIESPVFTGRWEWFCAVREGGSAGYQTLRVGRGCLEQGLKHDEGIDIAQGWMLKCGGETSDGLETEGVPKVHSTGIGADDEIELHATITLLTGMIERVKAESASDAATGGGGIYNVASVADMTTAAELVGTDVGSGDDLIIDLGDEDLTIGTEPVRDCRGFGDIAVDGEGFTSADGGREDAPDGGSILGCGGTDEHV